MLKPKVMGFGDNAIQFNQEPTMMDFTESFMDTNSLSVNAPVTDTSPFYLVKNLPAPAQITGSTNLLAKFGLESTYNKFSGKKLKESLSSFLPDVPGVSDIPGNNDGSSLRSLIDKPPIVGSKEIQPLSNGVLMAAFRLHPGPLPEQFRPLYLQNDSKKRHKHHKNKNRPDLLVHDTRAPELEEGKKHKKRKHDDSGGGGEKKKRKKEKKKKKEREKERF